MARHERVEAQIKKLVAEVLIRRVKDSRIGFVSILSVTLSKDLSFAKIYYSEIGTEAQKKQTALALKSAAGFIKGEISDALKIRTIPNLAFIFDDSIERGDDILSKLKKLSNPSS